MRDAPRRWLGIGRLAVRRTYERATGVGSRRLWLSVTGVAIAVGLVLVVTGVGLGLASQSTVRGEGVDYWLVPESGGGTTAVVSTGGPQFGQVHAASARIDSYDRVDYATPVLLQVVRVRAENGESEYVLAAGVVPSERTGTVAGVSTADLSPGDPYFTNGSYDGRWTGDVVLSPGAAQLLNASAGTGLSVVGADSATRSLAVIDVGKSGAATGAGQLPVAVFRLSELQALTGADTGDRADQILVGTDSAAVEDELAGVYPGATVVARSGLNAGQVADSDLPLAVSVTAFVVALIVGTLSVATTMGLELVADRRNLAVLAAIGYPRRDRSLLVVVQTLTVTLVGGALGCVLGTLGIAATNALVAEFVVAERLARLHPVLYLYGLAVAVGIGLLAAPYLLVVLRRTTALSELTY